MEVIAVLIVLAVSVTLERSRTVPVPSRVSNRSRTS